MQVIGLIDGPVRIVMRSDLHRRSRHGRSSSCLPVLGRGGLMCFVLLERDRA